MLTGQNPFGAGDGTNSTMLLYRIVHEPVPALPEIVAQELSADMRPAILAALSKDPGTRPQDAASFKAMLHGAPVPVPGSLPVASSTLAEAAKGQGSKSKWLPYTVVGGICAVVLCMVFIFATADDSGGIVSNAVEDSTQAPNPLTSELDQEQENRETQEGQGEEASDSRIVVETVETRIVAPTARASSEYEPEIESTTGRYYEYNPINLCDGNEDSAWFEGVEGDGSGEWVEFSWPISVTLTALYIENGTWKNETRLEENNRIKRIRITFGDGSFEDFALKDPVPSGFFETDGVRGEKITFKESHETAMVRLTILETYAGSRWDDTAITEVSFLSVTTSS
jgi:hypothetical protein